MSITMVFELSVLSTYVSCHCFADKTCLLSAASPPTVNASEGQPVKVQCPNKDKATKVTWFKPDGTIINSGKYSARVKIISEGKFNLKAKHFTVFMDAEQAIHSLQKTQVLVHGT